MNMPLVTVLYAGLLIAASVAFDVAKAPPSQATGGDASNAATQPAPPSWIIRNTHWIPAMLGAPVLLAGLISFNPAARKHAIHAAVLLGTIGLLGGLMAIPGAIKIIKAAEDARPRAVALQTILLLLSASYVTLCVRSFIAARRARRAASI